MEKTMSSEHSTEPRHDAGGHLPLEMKEIVMGLHWDPPKRSATASTADLDALCVLFDAEDRVLEVVHPGNERAADNCVIHTGDSKNGSSAWDDERIFVFLEALPATVRKIAFVVLSQTDCPFDRVGGAYGHISDRITETELLRVELTLLKGKTGHAIATVQRNASGWRIVECEPSLTGDLIARLRQLTRFAKNRPPAGATSMQ